MPRIRVIQSLPREYLTVGEEYDVSIGEADVSYSAILPNGDVHPYKGTYGSRHNYKKYIQEGQMVLLHPYRR